MLQTIQRLLCGEACAVKKEQYSDGDTDKCWEYFSELSPGGGNDGDDYRPHYELDIVAGNEKVEVYVDAKSGAVKVKEREIRGEFDDFDDDDDVNYLAQAKISTEQAIKIAKAKASGTVTKVKLDKDDHRLVYEIEIKNGQTEYEFDIDAQTGEIVKFEEDLED